VDLLEGEVGSTLNALLAAVPASVDLGTGQAAPLLAKTEAAWQTWELLDKQCRMGPTTVSKLLARKRPRLIPVYDVVVECAIRSPPLSESWTWFQETLADHTVRAALATIQAQAGLATANRPSSVGLPRVLDVVLWMRHHEVHLLDGKGCPGLS
jgi:hypothetical protein